MGEGVTKSKALQFLLIAVLAKRIGARYPVNETAYFCNDINIGVEIIRHAIQGGKGRGEEGTCLSDVYSP